MKSILALSLASLALASPVPEAPAAAPPSFKIQKVISGGSGCPQGSIDVNFSDSSIMPIYFSRDFTASVGPSVSATESRKNCQINIDISYSAGWSYAVYSADFYGYADIDAGVTGTVKSTYYFSGETDQVSLPTAVAGGLGQKRLTSWKQSSSTTRLSGPTTGWYNKHDDVEISVWSPCSGDALLNVNAEVYLTPMGSGKSGTLAAIKEQARFTNSLYIKWRQC
jgi:hypothetical protein